MTAPPSNDEHRLSRLRFRAWRRGFSELDLIMGGFVDAHGRGLSETDLIAFEALLHEQDQDVYGWIVGQEPVPTPYDTPLMARLKTFSPTAA